MVGRRGKRLLRATMAADRLLPDHRAQEQSSQARPEGGGLEESERLIEAGYRTCSCPSCPARIQWGGPTLRSIRWQRQGGAARHPLPAAHRRLPPPPPIRRLHCAAAMTIKLTIKSRSGRDLLPDGIVLPSNVRRAGGASAVLGAGRASQPGGPVTLACCPPAPHSPLQATVEELRARFAELKPRYYPSRQRFTLPPREGARSGEALADGKRLVADYGLADGSVLHFKDLGPQVGAGRWCPGRAPVYRLRGGHLLSPLQSALPPSSRRRSALAWHTPLRHRLATPPFSFGSTSDLCWSTPPSTSCPTCSTLGSSARAVSPALLHAGLLCLAMRAAALATA